MTHVMPLPIKLYYPIASTLYIPILGACMLGIGYVMINVGNDNVFVIGLGILIVAAAFLIIMMGIILLFDPKPILVIHRHTLTYGHEWFRRLLNRDTTIYFEDIEWLRLDYYTYKNVKYWYIDMCLSDGKKIKLSLKRMKYDNVIINEKEIFHLIEQVHQKRIPPIYSPMAMTIRDRMTSMGVVLIVFVVLLWAMGYLL